MDFGEAINALKVGMRVCRKGWNGKGQYIQLAPEYLIRRLMERLSIAITKRLEMLPLILLELLGCRWDG